MSRPEENAHMHAWYCPVSHLPGFPAGGMVPSPVGRSSTSVNKIIPHRRAQRPFSCVILHLAKLTLYCVWGSEDQWTELACLETPRSRVNSGFVLSLLLSPSPLLPWECLRRPWGDGTASAIDFIPCQESRTRLLTCQGKA